MKRFATIHNAYHYGNEYDELFVVYDNLNNKTTVCDTIHDKNFKKLKEAQLSPDILDQITELTERYCSDQDNLAWTLEHIDECIRQSTHGQYTQRFARGFGKIYGVFETNEVWIIVYEARANYSTCGWGTYWVETEIIEKKDKNIIDSISKHFLYRLHDWERKIEEYNDSLTRS